jgi:putative oxidoreductase
MSDFGVLILRLTLGGLLAGHGAQKLFGLFGGHGLKGTGGFFESALGLKPGKFWAAAAGGGEFQGGVLTTLGFLHPVGPIIAMGPMIVAWGKAHWNKPIWATEGGAELPLMNLSVSLALIFAGPGKFSIDHMFGIRTPMWMRLLASLGVAVGCYVATSHPELVANTMQMGREQAQEQPEPVAVS